jgi:myo-inositol-1(or 4)-monophosphatase
MNLNLEVLLADVEMAVSGVGYFIKTEYASFQRTAVELKGKNDLVSYVDRTAEDRLVKVLSLMLPSCGFINEEAGTLNSDRDFVWVIDPLDGTSNFVYGIPFFCTSVGLLHRGERILGCVYDPLREDMYTAIRGKGAYLNGKRIHVDPAEELGQALVGTGFPYRKTDQMTAYFALLAEFLTRSTGLRRLGAAALDLCFVASGKFGLFYETSLKPWDVAAGWLILEEAGGRLTDFQGQPYRFGAESLLASNGHLHEQALAIIRDHSPQAGASPETTVSAHLNQGL